MYTAPPELRKIGSRVAPVSGCRSGFVFSRAARGVLPSWRSIASLIALFGCAPPAEVPSEPLSWDGEWEGFVETTRQTVFVALRFDQATVQLLGNRLRLDDLRLSDDSVSFVVDLGPQQLAFAGSRGAPFGDPENGAPRRADRIAGRVLASLAGAEAPPTEFTFQLFQLPSVAPQATRLEQWEQDIAHVRSRFLRYDRSYTSATRARATELLDRLETEIPELDDSEIVAAIARIAAAADNAHTRLYLVRNRTALRRVPLRLWWFSDGLFVIRARERDSDVVGCRVDSIGGRPIGVAQAAISQLFAGNESWRDYKSAYFLTAPAALRGVGVTRDSSSIRFDLRCAGRPRPLVLEAEPLRRLGRPTENWKNLSPAYDGEVELLAASRGRWSRPLPGVAEPLHLMEPDRNYWMETLAGDRTVYIHYARSQNDDEGMGFDDFGGRVLEVLDRPDIDAVIVDLRFNTGGNLGTAEGFFRQLTEHPDLVGGGRLMVLTDQATFSAGLFHAAQLRAAGATLVGREPGDRLEYWAEGGNVVLPHSRYTLHFSNGYHSYSGNPDPRIEKVFRSLTVPSLVPDVQVRTTSAQYFSGEDPLLDAALDRLRSSPPDPPGR